VKHGNAIRPPGLALGNPPLEHIAAYSLFHPTSLEYNYVKPNKTQEFSMTPGNGHYWKVREAIASDYPGTIRQKYRIRRTTEIIATAWLRGTYTR